ncbi:MAG: aminoglycoside phosphotransferase family protein [Dehalococcoidia bacterium]
MQPAMTRKYSERLGVLTGDQLQAALDRFDLGALLDAEPAPVGLFGQNVFLTTDRSAYVLRGAPHPEWQFRKERFFTRLIHERTEVPVPWPFLIDESPDIFGWAYALMPTMPGLQIGDPDVRATLSEPDRLALARAMGENLARLHGLTWPHCGEYDPDTGTIAPITTTFGEWAVARALRWLDLCLAASDATTEADVAWVQDVINGARDALDVPFAPTIVHHDYKENNAVAEQTANGWRITGLFDVGGAFCGDPEEDLPRSIATYMRDDDALARGFIQAYRASRPLRPGFEQRFSLYMLVDRLIIWEYGQRNRVWFEPGTTLREWAEPYTLFRLD